MSFKPWLLPFLTVTRACRLILFFEVNPYYGRRLKRRRFRGAFTSYTNFLCANKNTSIPETASLKDGGIGNTSEEEIPFEYSLAGNFFAVNELKSKKAYDFLKLCVACKKLWAEKFLAEDALRFRTFHF